MTTAAKTSKASSNGEASSLSSAQILKAAIFDAEDLVYEDVVVPEWRGVTVRVRGLSAEGRADFFLRGQAKTEEEELLRQRVSSAMMVALTVEDPKTSDKLFDVDNKDEIEALMKKSGAVIDRLNTVALRLSGMIREVTTEAATQFQRAD